jgi:hypothetical protein
MTCKTLRDERGNVLGIVCSRGRRSPRCSVTGCTSPSERQCDWPLRGKRKGATCSRHLCAKHTTERPDGFGETYDLTGETIDLCPAHAAMAPAPVPTPPDDAEVPERGPWTEGAR